MKRMLLMAGVVLASVVIPALPAHASWVADHCAANNGWDSHYRRKDAKAYADVAIGEGYEWGGGCWNDDNKDNTPNAPDSSGEGPDCSGLVFKTWELKNMVGADGFQFWDKLQNIHGPYTSTSFHNAASGWPFYKLPNKNASTTMYMDAFAKDGHVALLYTTSGTASGTDPFVEARGDADGVGVWDETYRSNSDYVAVRRYDWTPDCYPNCVLPGSTQTVTVP
jgi:hypothetical protein